MFRKGLSAISKSFEDLTNSPEKENLIVLLLHDVTGVKKKDIKALLEYGPQLSKIYGNKQDFSVNKNPKAKVGGNIKAKKKKANKGK